MEFIASEDIDDSLYSRQRYVIGDDAMHMLARSSVFLHGLGGVGIEIAKNVVLAGVKALHIQDPKICEIEDLGSQFYIRESDVDAGRTRAQASCSHLSELNPYVQVKVIEGDINDVKDVKDVDKLAFLTSYQVVVVTSSTMLTACIVNYCCRKNNIPFITADVMGVMGSLFCDFGDSFHVKDTTGEEAKELFIGDIQVHDNGTVLVKTLDNLTHGLDNGDTLTFKEVKGLEQLNSGCYSVHVINPYSFSIDLPQAISPGSVYNGGGIAITSNKSTTLSFETYHSQLFEPSFQTVDLGRSEMSMNVHLCYLLLKRLYELRGHFVRNNKDFDLLMSFARDVCDGLKLAYDDRYSQLLPLLMTSEGFFHPMAAFIGGVAGQEVLKAISHKFTPLQQWLHMDCLEIVDRLSVEFLSAEKHGRDRFLPLRYCINMQGLARLFDARIFLVGCGAIGCELLKNLALLGIGMQVKKQQRKDVTEIGQLSIDMIEEDTNENDDIENNQATFQFRNACKYPLSMNKMRGLIIVTDYDLIEKSNLNRQFLFRSHHIRQSKSVTASEVIQSINPDLNIVAYENKVDSSTEVDLFSNDFFLQLDACVNALDNVEARRYMDARCTANGISLFESGTLGTKGHVQSIISYITESYSSQQDPTEENQVAYCTLKSFPANMDHCIEWAREKFINQFHLKPFNFVSVWSQFQFNYKQFLDHFIDENHSNVYASSSANAVGDVETTNITASSSSFPASSNSCSATIDNNIILPEDLSDLITSEIISMIRFLRYKPTTWSACVRLARLKFEKHFRHKALQLLHTFPPDATLKDGSPFWQSPKRPPIPQEFSFFNESCLLYLRSCAQLFARTCQIPFTNDDLTMESLKTHLHGLLIPPFIPKNKVIVVDESVTKEEASELPQSQIGFDATNGNDVGKLFRDLVNNYRPNLEKITEILQKVNPQEFEKDDDSNGHVDFITASANLRAAMYGIENADRFHIKRIAGRIVPAIATTTAAVAGLVTMEIVKFLLLHKSKHVELVWNENDLSPIYYEPGLVDSVSRYRNCFLNLALPLILLSEPGPPVKMPLSKNESFTVWDTEVFYLDDLTDPTLASFKQSIEARFGLPISLILYGNRIIYSDFLPAQTIRLKNNIIDLLRCDEKTKTVDVLVSFRNVYGVPTEGEEKNDLPGPRIRFVLSR